MSMSENLRNLFLHPELVPWMIAAAIFLFLSKFISSQIEKWLADRVALPPIAQVEAFVLLLHFGIGMIAACYCFLFTSLPPPGIGPDVRSLFGPVGLRFSGYMTCASACLITSGSLVVRGGFHTTTTLAKFGKYAAHLSRMIFVGVIASWVIVTYAALVSATILQSLPVPEAGSEIVLWWYTWASLMSFSAGPIIYGSFCFLQWLWARAGTIP